MIPIRQILISTDFSPPATEAFRVAHDLANATGAGVVVFHVSRLHEQAGALYQQPDAWARRAILNVAHSGRFSSDRTIMEYARGIWRAYACPVDRP